MGPLLDDGDVSVLRLGENFGRYEILDALVVGGVRALQRGDIC